MTPRVAAILARLPPDDAAALREAIGAGRATRRSLLDARDDAIRSCLAQHFAVLPSERARIVAFRSELALLANVPHGQNDPDGGRRADLLAVLRACGGKVLSRATIMNISRGRRTPIAW